MNSCHVVACRWTYEQAAIEKQQPPWANIKGCYTNRAFVREGHSEYVTLVIVVNNTVVKVECYTKHHFFTIEGCLAACVRYQHKRFFVTATYISFFAAFNAKSKMGTRTLRVATRLEDRPVSVILFTKIVTTDPSKYS